MSKCDNPCENAAFTEYLIEKKDIEDGILFLYRNTQSVFIGKNGNPWMDCNLPNVKRDGIKLVRKYVGTCS
jgi:lipoate-protein ligase A